MNKTKLIYLVSLITMLFMFKVANTINNSNISKIDTYKHQNIMMKDNSYNKPIIYTSDIETHPNRKISINEILSNIIAFDVKKKQLINDISIIDVDNYKDNFSNIGIYRFQVKVNYSDDKKTSTFINVKVLKRSNVNIVSNHNLTTGNSIIAIEDILKLFKADNFKYKNEIKNIKQINNKKYICELTNDRYIDIYTQFDCLTTDNYIPIEEIQGGLVRFLNIFSILFNLDNNYQLNCNFFLWFTTFSQRWEKAISIFEIKEVYRSKI